VSTILCKYNLKFPGYSSEFTHFLHHNRTNGRQLKVRLGEWDASQATEGLAPQEYTVSRIFIHPSYNAGNLRNSIAILRLSTPVNLGQVICVLQK
jgi:hypothetical protein